MRFDEIELEAAPLTEPEVAAAVAVDEELSDDAPRFRRLLALLTDLSLFAALSFALAPLLPQSPTQLAVASLAGFIVIVSYYYFVGSWLFWGKTIGGAIFDVRVVSEAMTPRAASMRWAGLYISLFTAGIGFLFAALPSRRSLADRLSSTRCVAA